MYMYMCIYIYIYMYTHIMCKAMVDPAVFSGIVCTQGFDAPWSGRPIQDARVPRTSSMPRLT